MKITELKNKKVAVLGAGAEGISSLLFLSKHGAEVTLLDKNDKLDPEILEEARKVGAKVVLGDSYLDNLNLFDLVLKSPGIRMNLVNKKVSKEKITSQTKLFFDFCPCEIIGVTGTKGKGTTSALIFEMLKQTDKDAYLGGNIGVPPLDFMDKLNTQSIVVLELSSFQLEDLQKSPHIGVMLMITSDHLEGFGGRNFHDTLGEYVDAKRNLVRFQTSGDFTIINRDYPATNESDVYTDGKIFYVSRERQVDEGTFLKDEAIWLRVGGVEKKIIDTKDISIPGAHNFENVAAASIAGYLCGVSIENMRLAINSFKGLPHRLELVAEINGVKYFDDSFAVNPGSTIAAIASFKQPKILVLGGVSEGMDFLELSKAINKDKSIKAIIGIGQDWEEIKSKIQNPNILLVEGATNMNQIVLAAFKIARSGDIVLLSPACKSFDMFKDYKDRGDQFKEEVRKLQN